MFPKGYLGRLRLCQGSGFGSAGSAIFLAIIQYLRHTSTRVFTNTIKHSVYSSFNPDVENTNPLLRGHNPSLRHINRRCDTVLIKQAFNL